MTDKTPEESPEESKTFNHKFEGEIKIVNDILHCEVRLDGKVMGRVDVDFVDQNTGTVTPNMAIYNILNELKLRLQERFRGFYKDVYKDDPRLSKG